MNIEQRINSLIATANELVEILIVENQALEENKAHVVEQLLKNKDALARGYERGIEALRKLPKAEIQAADRDLIEKLKIVGHKVDDLSKINGKLLKVAIAANRSVIDAFADAVVKAASAADTYGETGAQTGARDKHRSMPMSLDAAL